MDARLLLPPSPDSGPAKPSTHTGPARPGSTGLANAPCTSTGAEESAPRRRQPESPGGGTRRATHLPAAAHPGRAGGGTRLEFQLTQNTLLPRGPLPARRPWSLETPPVTVMADSPGFRSTTFAAPGTDSPTDSRHSRTRHKRAARRRRRAKGSAAAGLAGKGPHQPPLQLSGAACRGESCSAPAPASPGPS